MQYNTQKFVEKSQARHGTKYDYSETEYKNSLSKLDIICKLHGKFSQTAVEHMRGKGCSHCAKRPSYTTKEFIDKARIIHDSYYEYDKAVYINSGTKIIITCPKHGDFLQKSPQHFTGQGCSKCTKMGYNPRRISCLYILTCGPITKVGITSRLLEDRVTEINRFSGKNFITEFFIRFEDGEIPQQIEWVLLKELKQQNRSISENFNGSTECFLDVDLSKLLIRVTQLCADLLSK